MEPWPPGRGEGLSGRSGGLHRSCDSLSAIDSESQEEPERSADLDGYVGLVVRESGLRSPAGATRQLWEIRRKYLAGSVTSSQSAKIESMTGKWERSEVL